MGKSNRGHGQDLTYGRIRKHRINQEQRVQSELEKEAREAQRQALAEFSVYLTGSTDNSECSEDWEQRNQAA
jgi:hypothetical protein